MSNKTYVNENLKDKFCDKQITGENASICPICNVTIYSKHCLLKHKQLCGLSGRFGYKCLICNKFTYRRGGNSTYELKSSHNCNNIKPCVICFEPKLINEIHICKLKKAITNKKV